ncbi:expressed protein [Batrachochytrium dendrobatidis JAM81]|uniref:Expressed protein n=1 Tax=Batrachochytrium dendrobatidis (strain JAM81 / FGSC 10211) TaxID=684364 RepID=F4NWQ4_BATDJ|nr:uncharacterized protein BATDEDRAFT_36662 [Batrachochytrium dendrobatidis JAM81]EGF82864.1 expressed protein [Batrachochytrium dendrobatidis JAM81]|eukprot:XP_006676863.1 expressed protein [Batrachochytrium dendrobatidis JAM81]
MAWRALRLAVLDPQEMAKRIATSNILLIQSITICFSTALMETTVSKLCTHAVTVFGHPSKNAFLRALINMPSD